MTHEQRNELLAEMTDEVGDLVLDDNRAQTLTLAIARRPGVAHGQRACPLLATCSRPRAGSTAGSSSCPPTNSSPSARPTASG